MIEVVTAGDDRASRWHIAVDPDLRVVELAALLKGLGQRVTVEFREKGSAGQRGVILRPVEPGSLAPTAAQIRDILQHGVDRLPVLSIRAYTFDPSAIGHR